MLAQAPIRRLLVVDDDPMVCELLTNLLQADGFDVSAVQSGEAAITALTQQTCDAILTDLRMPGTGGLALARHLRRAENPPLLLGMSAGIPALEEGKVFEEFLQKPFTVAEVRAALERAERRRLDGSDAQASSRAETKSLRDKEASSVPEKGSTPSDTAAADTKVPNPRVTEVASILNAEIFGKLRSALGASQLLQLYEMTANDVDSRLLRMHVSLNAGDFAELREEAHAIKGGCAMVGAVELSQLAAIAETGSETDSLHLQEMAEACIRLRQVVTIVSP